MARHFKFILPLALLSLSLIWTACFKDHFSGSTAVATVTFAGRILDESGQPITGAQVRAGGELTLTDANGVFRLPPLSLPADNAILQVNKIGYFDFSRAYIVEPSALKPVTIPLLRKVQVGAFSASAGGTVQVPGGAQLVFPAGAVQHSGTVLVYARYLDPTAADLPFQMPGDLRGIRAGGEEQTLATFGMLGVELVGQSNGQVLQLAAGKEAEITMPIAASQAGAAPSEIPLWHYDNDKARWIEEGKAQKVGNQYVGKVKHFSFWNCDDFLSLVVLKGRVVFKSVQRSLVNAQIRLTILSNGWQGWANTDGNGHFAGAVPVGEKFKMEVMLPEQCGGTVLFTQEIGPFSADVTLPDIVINDPQLSTVAVSGRLTDCNGQPVDRGYVKLEWSGGIGQVGFPDANGNFDFTFLNCAASSTAEVKGYDLTTELESPVQNVTFPPNQVSLGDIVVCQSLSEFIKYNFDGTAFTILDPGGDSNGQATFISGENALQQANIAFGFTNNGQTGTFPLDFLSVNKTSIDSSSVPNLNTTLTSWGGQAGQFSVGTFGGTFKDWQGQNHTVSGSYRVERR